MTGIRSRGGTLVSSCDPCDPFVDPAFAVPDQRERFKKRGLFK